MITDYFIDIKYLEDGYMEEDDLTRSYRVFQEIYEFSEYSNIVKLAII